MSRPKASTVKGVQALLRQGVKGDYSAGNGLYLAVNGKGVGSWLFRYQMNGKRERMGLGSVNNVSLAEASAVVVEQKKLIAKGVNPKDARELKRQEQLKKRNANITFDDVAADYIATKRNEWESAHYVQQ